MKHVLKKVLEERVLWGTMAGAALFIVAALIAGAYLNQARASALAERDAATYESNAMRERAEAAEAEIANLRTLLESASAENQGFAERVEQLANTVGFLDTLSKTDRELLQKYSSVYFLNENYIPDQLSPISDELLLRAGGDMQLHTRAMPFLEKLVRAAEADGISLRVLSAYRSYGTQSALKADYKKKYGTGANAFSADQGYSEHQLGTTLDFTTPETGQQLGQFKATDAYRWLLAHAHEYGFILSYPENNSYFVFEPWHWRFVGVDLAKRLHFDGISFYDLDQREINAYLGRIFQE